MIYIDSRLRIYAINLASIYSSHVSDFFLPKHYDINSISTGKMNTSVNLFGNGIYFS